MIQSICQVIKVGFIELLRFFCSFFISPFLLIRCPIKFFFVRRNQRGADSEMV